MLVLYVEFETIDSSETWQHVLRIYLYLSIGDICGATIDLVDYALHIVAFAFAFAPFLQLQREVTVRRRLLKIVAVASNERVDAQLGQVFDTFFHLF